MPKIIDAKTGKFSRVKENDFIQDACRELGVEFGCSNGICGTCMIDVVDGENNLFSLTENEEILERDKKHRLACQCKIKKGDMKISW